VNTSLFTRSVFAASIFLFCAVLCFAEPIDLASLARPGFRIYTDKDGLPQNVIECLTFDKKGYLWVGTQNGAAYYNGRNWTTVNMPNRTASNYVYSILAAADGSMWFGTQLAGLSRLQDGKWETFDTANSGLASNEIRSLVEISTGPSNSTLWIGTGAGGVARYESGKWTTFKSSNSALRSDNVRSMAVTSLPGRASTLWVGTLGGGLARYEDGRWSSFDTSNSGLPSNQVRCLIADRPPQSGGGRATSLWIGTTGGGLARYEEGRWTIFTEANSGLPSNVVRSLAETVDASGRRTIWVGTNGNGLGRFEAGRWSAYATGNSKLPNDAVLSLIGDSSPSGKQSLWIGTLDGGLAHYVPGGWSTFDPSHAISGGSQVWSLLETTEGEQGSVFWFGTTGGLARFEAGRWTSFTTRNSGLPANYTLSLLQTRAASGRAVVWVGTNGAGLGRYESGQWTTLNTRNSGLPGNVILAMLETAGENGSRALWVGTESGGLGRYQDGNWTKFDTSNSGLPHDKVLSLVETISPAGKRALWAGTHGGLTRYEGGRWTTFNTANSPLPNNQVWGLRETISDTGQHFLWAGTVGGGVARFDPASPNGKWLTLSEATNPALPNDTVWQIRQDAGKRIYLFTDKGIARLTPRMPTREAPAEYDLYVFTTADGLPSNGCNQGAALLDSRGRLWVGTGAGAAVFDPAIEREDRTPKTLYIERTLLGGRERIIPEQAVLGYNENNFQFEYALLSYFRESDTRYRFQLAGFDAAPSEWVAENRKEYTNLGEGDYVFNVWARDYAGNVAGPAVKAFSIRAAPWRTWWAFLLYTLGVAAGAFAAVRVQINRVNIRAKAALEKQKEQARLNEAELRAEAAEAQAKAVEAENRRKSEELEFARQLQLSMLPKQNILLEQVEIVGQIRTATEVGGDYYDFIKVDENRYCVAIGDATGHGVGAGLVVGMVKTALLNSVLRLGPDSTVQGLMVDLNTTLKAALTHRGVGMCLGIAVVDTRTMAADICSTGMPFPCLYEGRTGRVQTIEMPGPPLGFMKKIQVRSLKVQLGPQDRLIFLSDGFHERMNAADECWGYETVTREVTRICQTGASAEETAGQLISACDQFARGRETDDDMTVVVISVLG